MYIVITGDIVSSRRLESKKWIDVLKAELNAFGDELKDWEIYRGDSFQLLVEAGKALYAVFRIKSAIKQISPLDVRMGLGLGHVSYRAGKVLESNGSAFVYSGDCFDDLKKQKLLIKSDFSDLDETLNLMFSLASLSADYWKPVTAQIIHKKLSFLFLTQLELAHLLGKKQQSSISEGLKRGGFDELQALINFFENKVKQL